MALLTANQLLILSMKGNLGNAVVYPHRFKPGIYVLRRKGARSGTCSAAEVQSQDQFRKASAYAKMAKDDPSYQAGRDRTHRTTFHLAVADFLNVPVVKNIDATGFTGRVGECIRVLADDDFQVEGVKVRLLDLTGAILEEGQAAPDSNAGWVYTATSEIQAGQTIVIEATATDKPGNRAVRKMDHACGPRKV